MGTPSGGLIIAHRLTGQVSQGSQKTFCASTMAEPDNLKFLLPLIATLYVVFFFLPRLIETLTSFLIKKKSGGMFRTLNLHNAVLNYAVISQLFILYLPLSVTFLPLESTQKKRGLRKAMLCQHISLKIAYERYLSFTVDPTIHAGHTHTHTHTHTAWHVSMLFMLMLQAGGYWGE